MSKPDPAIERHLAILAKLQERSLEIARNAAEEALATPAGDPARDEAIWSFVKHVEAIESMIKLECELAAKVRPQPAPPRPVDIRHLH